MTTKTFVDLVALCPAISHHAKNSAGEIQWAERLTGADGGLRVALCFRPLRERCSGPSIRRAVQASFAAADWPGLHGLQPPFLWDVLDVWATGLPTHVMIAYLKAADVWLPLCREVLPQIGPTHEALPGTPTKNNDGPDLGFRVYKLHAPGQCMACTMAPGDPSNPVTSDSAGHTLCRRCAMAAGKSRVRAARGDKRAAKMRQEGLTPFSKGERQ